MIGGHEVISVIRYSDIITGLVDPVVKERGVREIMTHFIRTFDPDHGKAIVHAGTL